MKRMTMKYIAASLLSLLILAIAGTAHAETPVPDPFDGFEIELPPDFPPFPVPPGPPTPGPFPFPFPFPFPEVPPFPFPDPGDIGIPVGSVTAGLHVECGAAEYNVWVEVTNTTDDPAIVTVDSPFMEPELVAVAAHDDLVVPVEFDHIEHNTISATAEFDGGSILDDEQSIECLAPNPSYEFHYDCGSETAALTLINNGLLTAQMGHVVVPHGPDMHSITPGGNKEVALPHGEAQYLETDVIADGEVLFHGVWGFDCPEVDVPAAPEADPGDGADEAPAEEADVPGDEPAANPESGKLADDSEPIVVNVDTPASADDDGDDDDTQPSEANTDGLGEEAMSDEERSDTAEDDREDGGSRSPVPALALVTLLGVGGVAGATAWGRR